MNNPIPSLRMPAEWEHHSSVLLAWPHAETDWAPMLEEAQKCFADIIRAISAREHVILVGPERLCAASVAAQGFDPERVTFVDVPTNDTWARDFGPITIFTPSGRRLVDFKFNGWGLKFASDRDNLINSRLVAKGILPAKLKNQLSFVLEGGSIESDGAGTLLTTSECLLSPNRNGGLSRAQIQDHLCRVLGFDHVLWLDHGALAGDDTDSHIDTLARFAPDDTIVYCGPGDDGDPNNPSLIAMREQLRAFRTALGDPYNLIELPLPAPIYDADGMQLPATYANFLIAPGVIYMPSYRQPRRDFLASQILKVAYPGHEVVSLDCVPLIQQHGSLHCITMQL